MRLLNALSWLVETWKISRGVKDETAVDANVEYYAIFDAGAPFVVTIHIRREASVLSVLLHRAIPGPQQAERAAGMALTHFFYPI